MKNFLKAASAFALSCTFLAAHAQQGDGKMMKKEAKTEDKMMKKEDKAMSKDKLGKMSKKNDKMMKGVKMESKEKM